MLVRRESLASRIRIEGLDEHGRIVFVNTPFSSCVRSVSRERSAASRPTAAEGTCDASMWTERSDSKKRWREGKKVLSVQWVIPRVNKQTV